MRTRLNVRLEFDPKYPREVWVYDKIHGIELCHIIDTADLHEYLAALLKIINELDSGDLK